jgi:hypothetical protein
MAKPLDLKQEAGDDSNLFQSAEGMIVNQTKNTYNSVIPPEAYKKLAEEYKKEVQSGDSVLGQIIEKIQHFSNSADTVFLGLEQKLKDAGYENDYQFASKLKEDYTKYLTSNNLSKATLKIHAFLLARIYVAFNLFIPTAVNEGKTKQEIKQLLLEKIVTPVEETLGIDNVLGLYQDDVLAMVYFLTGNCHINWSTNVNLSPGV